MSASKLSNLLPIPPGTRQPHPYQVLGLDDGEQDKSKINAAIEKTVTGLKSARSSADPKLWKQAAKLAMWAQEVLADPEQKAKLDARFGIVDIDPSDVEPPAETDGLSAFLPVGNPLEAASEKVEPASTDPLASVLPTTSNPLAPALETEIVEDQNLARSDASESGAHAENLMPPGLFGTPRIGPVESAAAEQHDSVAIKPSPVVVKSPDNKRHRQSKSGTFVFAGFAIASCGIIGALVYFLVFGSGQVAITSSDGKITISTEPSPRTGAPRVAEPRPVDPNPVIPIERKPRDPIMGDLGPAGPENDSPPRSSGLTDPIPDLANPELPVMDDQMPNRPTAEMATDTPPLKPSEDSTALPSDDEPMMADAPEMSESLTDPVVSDEMMAATDQKISAVRKMIRSANWKEMKPAAEALLDQPMSDQQSIIAESLYEVADLASYYRIGIQRAVADLKAGDDFEVVPDFRVIIVETGDDLLTVRYDATNRSFRLDELPWPLAHRLGTFSMPDSPTTLAAKSAYQAIAPASTDEYRAQAIRWLRGIDEVVEGADPERVADTVEETFAAPSTSDNRSATVD